MTLSVLMAEEEIGTKVRKWVVITKNGKRTVREVDELLPDDPHHKDWTEVRYGRIPKSLRDK